MKWLEAMLAFALTMVVFSTMVTVLMEILYRIYRAREKIFKKMLERMFSQVLWPIVRQRLAGADFERIQDDFVNAITRNSVADEVPRVAKVPIRRVDNSKMTVLEFAERLAGTEAGKAIAAEGKERVIAIVNDLAQKFERFTSGSRSLLTDRSLSVSLILSMILAFALNVDAVVLFRAFVQDAKLTQTVNERFGAFAQEMKSANESLQRVKGEGNESAEKDIEAIQKSMKQVQDQFGDLKSIGLPIGYEYFPGCKRDIGAPLPKIDIGDCANAPRHSAWAGIYHNLKENKLQFLYWLSCVFLGGLLIGLGAPFWFDLAQGLSRSLQVLKALGGGREKEKEKDEAALAAAAGTSPPPKNPVEAFTTAIAASPASEALSRSAGRALLLPNGRTV